MLKTLVIIPTYNELENIQALVPILLKLNNELEILVVDDNSPDGTGAAVTKMQKTTGSSRLHLLSRPAKQGLGRAYIAGMQWGLERPQYAALVEMDADFSHRPEDLLKLIAGLEQADAAVGSRWISGGATVNWSWWRQLISRCGSAYAEIILRCGLHDWTGGFNAWTRPCLLAIQIDRITSDGYSFQIEMKYRAIQARQRLIEIPIIFEERRAGQSKMSFRIILEALKQVWSLPRRVRTVC